MTTITGDIGIGWGVPPSALGGNPSYVRVRPASIGNTPTKVTMLPFSHRSPLATDGTFSLSIDPLLPDQPHVFEFELDGGRYLSEPIEVIVPATGTHKLADLVPTGGAFVAPVWYREVVNARADIVTAGNAATAGAAAAGTSATNAASSAAAAAESEAGAAEILAQTYEARHGIAILPINVPVPADWPSKIILRENPV